MKKRILIIILILILAFIWIHSIMPESVSAEESGRVMEFIKPFLEIFVGKGHVTDHLVRKLAHFTEFSCLGFVVMLYARLSKNTNWRRVLLSVMFGFTAAFVDETIQIFSNRGSQIADVWLDVAGVVFGTLAALVVSSIVVALKKNKK